MKFYRIFTILLCLMLGSCSLLEQDPKIIHAGNYYKSEEEVLKGLTGVYGAISSASFYGSTYSLVYSNMDDLCYRAATFNNIYLEINRHSPGTKKIYDMWSAIYAGIKNANMFMEAIVDNEYDPEGKYYNEAKFLRAYYHFILAQTWGHVPLMDKAVDDLNKIECAATDQFYVLKWVADQMEECIEFYEELYESNYKYINSDLNEAPTRICKNTVHGILARVYLFMSGATVDRKDEMTKDDCYALAMSHAKTVINSADHQLNPDYSQVFKNMMSEKYDHEYRESMWEVDFIGDRSSSDCWSNGQVGVLLGIRSGGSSTDYINFKCNYAYGRYNGSLKLWDMYWKYDRTSDEVSLSELTDERQIWNMPPYYYNNGKTQTFYSYNSESAKNVPTAAQAIRNSGKFRREVEYEGVKDFKSIYSSINFPILRYSDILLMFAEASNELNGLTQEAYDCVKAVRDRAKIKTIDYTEYDTDTFRELVRNERGRELCFEALRRYDLTRWGMYVKEMNDYVRWTEDDRWKKSREMAYYASEIGRAVEERHIVLPIPSLELGVNPLLEQHPLW